MNITATSSLPAQEILVTLTRKGQITIPAAIRRLLGLQTEGKVALVIRAHDKAVQLQVPRYPTVASLAGAAGTLNRKVPWKDMLDTARAEALARKRPPTMHG